MLFFETEEICLGPTLRRNLRNSNNLKNHRITNNMLDFTSGTLNMLSVLLQLCTSLDIKGSNRRTENKKYDRKCVIREQRTKGTKKKLIISKFSKKYVKNVNRNRYKKYEYVTKDELLNNNRFQERDQSLEKQDLQNNKGEENETSTKDENINKQTVTDRELLKCWGFDIFSGSKVVTAENEPDYSSPTLLPPALLPVFDEIKAIKDSLTRVEVCYQKPVASLKPVASVSEAKLSETEEKNGFGDVDNKAQQMVQLFELGHLRIKTDVHDVYMIPQIRWHPQIIGGIPWNNLNEERWRLYTYSQYPHSAKKSAILLAQAGFAYYGSGRDSDDSVICYFCCATKRDWLASDVIFEIHKHLSPDCSMVTGLSCNNVPMALPAHGLMLFSHLGNKSEMNASEGNKQRSRHEGSMNEIECDSAEGSHLMEGRHNNLSMPSGQVPTSVQMTNPTVTRPITSGSSVGQQVPSATHNHPSGSGAPSSSLISNITSYSSSPSVIPHRTQATTAQQGNRNNSSSENTTPTFTTTGTTIQTSSSNGQQVTQQTATSSSAAAASSQINQGSQNPSASAAAASTAPSISSTNQNTNQPQGNLAEATKENTESVNKANEKGPTYGELGIITERPKRFEYAVRATRYASFDSWPRDHHLKKENLADAGFYYAGYGDCARCFYCGGGLRNWEDEDNVWVEHARWFPKCAYIRQTVGQQFVDTVQELNKRYDKITFKMVTDKMGSSAASFHLDSKNVPLIRDPAVLAVLDMGYREEDVIEVANIVKDENNGTLSADKVFEKMERCGKIRRAIEPLTALQSSKLTSNPSEDENVMNKLKQENGLLRQQTVCKICMDKEVAVVFLPCGHFVSCSDCAAAMKDCPVCRKQVRGIVRAFMG